MPRHLRHARAPRGRRYDAAGYVGPRPTFGAGDPELEAFLFDFSGDIYDRTIEVEFIDFIRPDETFPNGERSRRRWRRTARPCVPFWRASRPTIPCGNFRSARRSLREHWIVASPVARTPRKENRGQSGKLKAEPGRT
nr:riboflavin kinase [Methyloceanibacter methanicus]